MLDEQYEGNDHFVRGIKCEKWSYQMNFTRDPAAPPNTYTVSHFFPVASWQVRAAEEESVTTSTRVQFVWFTCKTWRDQVLGRSTSI